MGYQNFWVSVKTKHKSQLVHHEVEKQPKRKKTEGIPSNVVSCCYMSILFYILPKAKTYRI
jgi:hypothetical protein